MKTFLLFLLPVLAFARPPVDVVPSADLNHQLRVWRKTQALNWRYITAPELKVLTQYLPGDVAMWEPYTGQPIAPGDLFIADFPGKDFKGVIRECKSVTDTNIETTWPTTIPLTEVNGIVRRGVRVQP